jgi:hypothetical protein
MLTRLARRFTDVTGGQTDHYHQALRVTPAMPAGIADHAWSVEEIIGLLGQTLNQRRRRTACRI